MTRVALLVLVLTACGPRHPPGWVGVDAAVSCDAACAHLAAMGCDDGKPTPAGVPCVTVCQHGKDIGYLPPPTTCIAHAPDCETASNCR